MSKVIDQIKAKIGSGSKLLAVLIDPDRFDESSFPFEYLKQIDILLVGSSSLKSKTCDETCQLIKQHCDTPVILFPGDYGQITSNADAILFMSLISGRNPEYLISQQVKGAPLVKKAGIEPIPTGYMLVGEDSTTAAAYMTQSLPIPSGKSDIAAVTAMAGEMLGQDVIYMDAGSGAKAPIEMQMIRTVKESIESVLFVGGGIRSYEQLEDAWEAGADVVVVGSLFEDQPELLEDFLISRSKFADSSQNL